MPLNAATRTEPDVLHAGALATSALDPAEHLERPVALAGPPTAPRGGHTWAHKTGVGGVVKRPDRAAEATKSWLDLLEKGLTVSGDAWKRYATGKGRDQAALNKAVADSLEAFVKAEGVKMAEQLPFGKVIMVSFELSLAFADGVGRGLEKVNAELEKKYDVGRIAQELGPEDVQQIQVIRGYLANNTQELNRVLAEGLADVAEKATQMVLSKLGEIPGKVLGDLSGQIAGQLVKHNDLLAILRSAVDEAGKSIPAGRAKVERLAFHFVASAFLNQLENKDLQAKLSALPGVAKADKPVDVALLGTIIKMLADNSYDTYKRHVPVDYATAEVRQMLITTARGLAAGLVDVKLEDSGSTQIVVEKDRIALPAAWLATVTEDADALRELGVRAWARNCELSDYLKRLRVSLETRRGLYAREYTRKTKGESDVEIYNQFQGRWVDDWHKAHQKAAAAVDAIVDELGEPPGYSRVALGQTIRINLGYPNEPGLFTPWVS